MYVGRSCLFDLFFINTCYNLVFDKYDESRVWILGQCQNKNLLDITSSPYSMFSWISFSTMDIKSLYIAWGSSLQILKSIYILVRFFILAIWVFVIESPTALFFIITKIARAMFSWVLNGLDQEQQHRTSMELKYRIWNSSWLIFQIFIMVLYNGIVSLRVSKMGVR